MEPNTFAVEAAIEDKHWWFVGRRGLFTREIERCKIAHTARIIDVGSSTGTNLRMLRDSGFSNIIGLDSSDLALKWCAQKGLGPVIRADVTRLPFADSEADFVLATDVIEHIHDHEVAVAEIARILKPGGAVIVTVPTFQLLWGLQDEVAQHKRRYRKYEIERMVSKAGLVIQRSYYFNYILFFPILIARQLIRVMRPQLSSENEINSTGLNRFLRLLFAFDVATAPLIHPPFGVSALIVAIKPAQ